MGAVAGIVRTDGQAVDPTVLAEMARRLAGRCPGGVAVWTEPGRRAVALLAARGPSGAGLAVMSFARPGAETEAALVVALDGALLPGAGAAGPGGFPAAAPALFSTPPGEMPGHPGDGPAREVAKRYLDRLYLERLRGGGDDPLAFLEALDGAFALAIWDGAEERLHLVRDALGQRPLWWWHGRAGLAFASEPAALLAWPPVPRRLRLAALGDLLRFGYVPAPGSAWEGIQKLAPGHHLAFDARSGRLAGPRRWWDVYRGPAEVGLPPEAWRRRTREALARAVAETMGLGGGTGEDTAGGPDSCGAAEGLLPPSAEARDAAAGAPGIGAEGSGPGASSPAVGVFLSGGLDSSVVAALAVRAAGAAVPAFTARFAETAWDESPWARRVARWLGLPHTEVVVGPAEVEESLEALVRHPGEPLADASALAVHRLARAARGAVPVVLTGDGGDELFGGYPRHGALWLSERLPGGLRRALAAVGGRLPPRPGRKSPWNAARRFASALAEPPLRRYLAWRSLFAEADLRALLPEEAAGAARATDPLARWRRLAEGLEGRGWLDRAMAIDLLDYLPNDGLAKTDAAATAQGLEVRCPMLHPAVVDLARRMPPAVKWRRRRGRLPEGKRVLREALADLLPPEVRRRGKMGFGVPIDRWLAGPLAGWMRDRLLGPRARTRRLLRRKAVERLVAEHTARRADHSERLWALVVLETWMRAMDL